MRNVRRRWALAVFVVAGELLVSACAGPRSPIGVQVNPYESDVAIGKKATQAAPLPPAANPVPAGFPSFIQPPPPVPEGNDSNTAPVATPLPSTQPCPKAPTNAVAAVVAPNNVTAPPAKSQLAYRNDGGFTITASDGTSRKGSYPRISTRQVASKADGDGTFTYAVREQLGLSVTTTTYHVDPAKGLFLRSIATTTIDGGVDSFSTDSDSLMLLPLPVQIGAQVGGSAVDSTSNTNMTFLGTVTGHTRVDACGKLLDAFEVDITEGRITSAFRQVHFTATYDIGTQYGALSLAEQVKYDCDVAVNKYCDAGRDVETHDIAIVDSEPPLVVKHST